MDVGKAAYKIHTVPLLQPLLLAVLLLEASALLAGSSDALVKECQHVVKAATAMGARCLPTNASTTLRFVLADLPLPLPLELDAVEGMILKNVSMRAC